MDKLIDALTDLVRRGLPPSAPRARHGDTGNGPATPRTVAVDTSDAPACVKRLVEAMAAGYYYVELGGFSLYETGKSTEVTSLEHTIAQACERGDIDPSWVEQHGGPGGSTFDPAKTVELGSDGGGMSYYGVSWSGGTLGLVAVEHEDPVQSNLLKHVTTPEELFELLAELDGEEDDDNDLPALKEAVGA